mmetsp:Transcript_13450/g.23934  ORF Transcript_13450/g.23934 Transcript_13450/m.23934 type:complete len:221 (-) Transcript_13450:500-1162(-)
MLASPSRSRRPVTLISSSTTSPSASWIEMGTLVPTKSSLRRAWAHSDIAFSSKVPPWFHAEAPSCASFFSCSEISSVDATCLGALSLRSSFSSSVSSRLKYVVFLPSARVRYPRMLRSTSFSSVALGFSAAFALVEASFFTSITLREMGTRAATVLPFAFSSACRSLMRASLASWAALRAGILSSSAFAALFFGSRLSTSSNAAFASSKRFSPAREVALR